MAKRAGVDDGGEWLLASDHPAWEPAPWSDEMEILGEVAWTARTLLGRS